ncbi:MAG: hypothetical protein GVY19_11045 [Bacteroidetes bacterium]|jgi:hypothetical protein|nr:hypothetical protein [Bacteroidota bacterium]
MKRVITFIVISALLQSGMSQNAEEVDQTLRFYYNQKYYYLQQQITLSDETATKFWNTYLKYHRIFLALDKEKVYAIQQLDRLEGRQLRKMDRYMDKIDFTRAKVLDKFHRKIRRILPDDEYAEYLGSECYCRNKFRDYSALINQ